MPTADEAPAVAPAGTHDGPTRLRRLLRRRLRQLSRVALGLVILLAVAASALAIWWLTSLGGLPDIGDPFDVAAFRAFRLPDDRNAFASLRRASERLTPLRGQAGGTGADPRDVRFSWSIANPFWREWAGANREAIGLFLQAADLPDAAREAGDPATDEDPSGLILAVIAEASRRQEAGDSEGAWLCHRGVLRMLTHFRRRGSTLQRLSAKGASQTLHRRLSDWAADPGTTIAQLHAALEEVLRNEPDPDWDISAIKVGYLELMRAVGRPMPASSQQEIEGVWTFRVGDMALSPGMVGHLEAARRFLLREPERSRRVLRLLCANYLAHAEARGRPRRGPAAWARFSYLTSTNPITRGKISVPLYPVGPSAPAGARALPPRELAGWLVATLDARMRLLHGHGSEWPWPPDRALDPRAVAVRKAHRDLVLMLAGELYHRERGDWPPSDEALVGAYLERVPDDSPRDVNDGTAPTVE